MPSCSKCHATIFFARTVNDKAMPINQQPDPAGNIVLLHQDGKLVAHVLTKAELAEPIQRGQDRFMSHYATCPGAASFRRRPTGETSHEAHTRHDDPVTSHTAAAAIGDLTERQRAVYAVLQAHGPITHEQLVTVYREHQERLGLPDQTEQSIRSRCSELVEAHWAKAQDRAGITSNGGVATRWAALSADLHDVYVREMA